jgi:ABC-type amino acid transport system permease subunit
MEATAMNVIDRGKSPMEQLIETVAAGLGSSVGWLADHGVLFGVFALIWVAFGIGLVVSQGSIDEAWHTIRGLPLLVQLVAWLLFLPVMAGLWVWETTWPLVVRLALVLSIAGWNLLVFLPKAGQAAGA